MAWIADLVANCFGHQSSVGHWHCNGLGLPPQIEFEFAVFGALDYAMYIYPLCLDHRKRPPERNNRRPTTAPHRSRIDDYTTYDVYLPFEVSIREQCNQSRHRVRDCSRSRRA